MIAVCVFRMDNRILVFEGFDSAAGKPFYRPLGGGVEPGETSKDAIIREIQEEIGQEIKNLKLLSVLENIFTLEGKLGHEIVFVYSGDFVNISVYEQASLEVVEDNHVVITATWKDLGTFDHVHRLVPDGLAELIESVTHTRSSC